MEDNWSLIQVVEPKTDNCTFSMDQNITSANITNTIYITNSIIITGMFLSVIALILTIFVYSILPEFRSIHGKNLITLSSCLITAFTMLILDFLLRNRISYSFCFAISLIIHITFLAAFFWTNVMTFDIWRTMTNLKPRKAVVEKSKKYWKYSVYAWTATILIAVPAVVIDKTDFVSEAYQPQFGINRCWLGGSRAFVLYFNTPVGIILFSNLVMFILTTRNLLLIKKMTKGLHVKQQQQRFYLYLKMFLLMGFSFISDLVLAGLLTSFHGVLLFVIFVCKARILREVRDKLKLYWCCSTVVAKKTSVSEPTLSSAASTASVSKV